MARRVAPQMPSAAEIAACKWLPDEELRVYSAEVREGPGSRAVFRAIGSGRAAGSPPSSNVFRPHDDVPSLFIGGKSDWVSIKTPRRGEDQKTRAPTCAACIWSKGRGTGSAGAAAEVSKPCSSSFWRRDLARAMKRTAIKSLVPLSALGGPRYSEWARLCRF